MAASIFWWEADAAKFDSSIIAPPQRVFVAGTNFPYWGLAFAGNAGSADEGCFFVGELPLSYGGEDVKISIHWTSASGGGAGENVTWGVKVIGRADDEALDTAATDTGTANDVMTAVGDMQEVSVTLSSPTLAAEDLFLLEVYRDYNGAGGGTALEEDAILLGISLEQL